MEKKNNIKLQKIMVNTLIIMSGKKKWHKITKNKWYNKTQNIIINKPNIK